MIIVGSSGLDWQTLNMKKWSIASGLKFSQSGVMVDETQFDISLENISLRMKGPPDSI